MSSTALEARVRQLKPRVAVIELEGEINGFADATLSAAYTEAEAMSPQAILLNFSQVDYINSTGIALIVTLLAKARKAHIRLLTCGLSEHYIEIFNITRLADFMSVYPTEASALADSAALMDA
ncbi:MAG TPA: STAS domain-containing protein [Ktedonobacterales bacterium]